MCSKQRVKHEEKCCKKPDSNERCNEGKVCKQTNENIKADVAVLQMTSERLILRC